MINYKNNLIENMVIKLQFICTILNYVREVTNYYRPHNIRRWSNNI